MEPAGLLLRVCPNLTKVTLSLLYLGRFDFDALDDEAWSNIPVAPPWELINFSCCKKLENLDLTVPSIISLADVPAVLLSAPYSFLEYAQTYLECQRGFDPCDTLIRLISTLPEGVLTIMVRSYVMHPRVKNPLERMEWECLDETLQKFRSLCSFKLCFRQQYPALMPDGGPDLDSGAETGVFFDVRSLAEQSLPLLRNRKPGVLRVINGMGYSTS